MNNDNSNIETIGFLKTYVEPYQKWNVLVHLIILPNSCVKENEIVESEKWLEEPHKF
jgi:hypothetical protein